MLLLTAQSRRARRSGRRWGQRNKWVLPVLLQTPAMMAVQEQQQQQKI